MVEREEHDEPGVGLPSLPGTYALMLRCSEHSEIPVGKLGVLAAQPGFYVYVGSALGPGGLASRVGRHCRREKSLRWHVDYLRAMAQIEEVWYATGKNHRECRWASVLQSLPGASVPLGDSGRRTAGVRRICSSLLCRLPWRIYGTGWGREFKRWVARRPYRETPRRLQRFHASGMLMKEITSLRSCERLLSCSGKSLRSCCFWGL